MIGSSTLKSIDSGEAAELLRKRLLSSSGASRARKFRHDLAREAPQLFLAAGDRQQHIFRANLV
jgi:hypothetical protein